MLDVVCIRKPIPRGMTIAPPPCICINASRTRYYSFLHIDDLCHTQPFALIRVLSIAVIERSTNPSTTNRYPIVEILSFISVEMVFNRLSNVRLLGIDTRPQANASLWLYRQSMLRKICNVLLESNLNHILTIKHLKITVGEYTYGLPRFRGAVGHGIQPIRYRMLKRMDSFTLSRDNLWVSINQNNISRVSFKLCDMY
jgi:hypothetical protein